MLDIHTAARLVSIGAALVGAALTLVMLGESSELAVLRTATIVALPLGCLAVVVGTAVRRRPWATAAALVGLGVCLSFSAIGSDSALSGESGRPLAVVASILSFAALVLIVGSLMSSSD
jgi:peptidoglycan/LPS O-acetylase OafA/YrhL